MMLTIELDKKEVEFDLFLPEEVKKFLKNNNIKEQPLLKNYAWTEYLIEDLEPVKTINFTKAKVVINHIHIDNSRQIRVAPEDYSKGKVVVKATSWSKGTFSDTFSIGFSVFAE
jgi:hypothetical protein